MRKLATIRIVSEVAPISGADLIEKVRVDGWWVVSKKGEFKPGDFCVFFEIDSLLPVSPQFSFLEKNGRKKSITDGKEYEGYRLKTVKLRGQLSQGLALPLSVFPQLHDKNPAEMLNTDLSDILGIVKYEPPAPACISGDIVGPFPSLIPKTDEERVQNINISDYYGKHFYVTEKIDGTSSTFYKLDGYFGACGRNMNFRESEKNTFWKIANERRLKEMLSEGYAIQGEVAGEGIQGNKLLIKGHKLFVFYVYDILKGEYLTLPNMESFCKDLALEMVPVVERDFILNHDCDQLLMMANRKSLINPSVICEGLVFRVSDNTQKISFKVLSNEYLLNEKEEVLA